MKKNNISGYFYYSQKHAEYMRELSGEMCWGDADVFVNGIPYTLLSDEKDNDDIREYKEKWGDVTLVYEGVGAFTSKKVKPLIYHNKGNSIR